MGNVEGFFAGAKSFELIKEQIGEQDKKNLKEIVYNGFLIKLDESMDDSSVVGVGEPYATIAKMLNEHFKK